MPESVEDLTGFLPAQIQILVQTVLALYIVVNPSGVSSIFLGLTKELEPVERVGVALRAVLTGAVTLAAFAVAGSLLLKGLHVTQGALQIAGGIFVFGVAFALARGKEHEFFGSVNKAAEQGRPKAVAYYPLAVPLIAGPASITVVMSMSAKSADFDAHVILLISIAAVCFLAFLSMMRIVRLRNKFGPGIELILPRIMGLVLAVIAIQILIDGVAGVLPYFYDAIQDAAEQATKGTG